MKNSYNFSKRDAYWQNAWEEQHLYETQDSSKKKKYYALVEFPYPSGDGLHVGHPRPYIGMDVIARKRRAEGFNVLYPMGWDAFGLPTENYAIKTGVHPKEVTKKNSDTFRRQIKALGASFDWSREVNTTDPEYYKWTQWIFLQLFKKGLAYKQKSLVNWCPKDKTGLANEEVIDGKCERCGTETEKKEREQWYLAITKYAERLDKDLDDVDYMDAIKTQQRNWIGKSLGSEINFEIKGTKDVITVFTTRPDTLFGATYMVLAPEHPLLENLKAKILNIVEVTTYQKKAQKTTDIDRTSEEREKTGIALKDIVAINPATKKEIPIFIADYVIAHYGTGAIMAVPAHDERDYAFATKYKLPITQVVAPQFTDLYNPHHAYMGEGTIVNSGKFDGMESLEARRAITKFVKGKEKVAYKLRDWLFSRQRYWGEPIPMVHCEKCGWSPLPESALPLLLPEVEKYEPTDTGESPLATLDEWVNTICTTCDGPAKRETDTMPNWAGSSWYFLRYTDPTNDKALANKKNLKKFLPVDWYNGGMEHTTLHLLYSRFWHKFLFDIGIAPTAEPYTKRTSHGLILAEGGVKMSKSKGNVVNPDSIIEKFGADTFRVYEMFMGPFDQAIVWNDSDIYGSDRFLLKVYEFVHGALKESFGKDTKEVLGVLHTTIEKVENDIEEMSFNTAIAQLMICINEFRKQGYQLVSKESVETFLKLLAPFAPHITEELWSMLGERTSIHIAPWPKVKKKYLVNKIINIPVQINGKVRITFSVAPGIAKKKILELVRADEKLKKWMGQGEIKKVIYIQDKILNIVIE